MTPTPLDTTVTEFGQAIRQLIRRLRAVGTAQGLSWPQAVVLCRLESGPATTADLARTEGMKPQSMRPIVAALEARGYIGRRPHPTDGRQVLLTLTEAGAAKRKTTRDAKWTWLAQAIGRLDAADRETLVAASEIIKRLVDAS